MVVAVAASPPPGREGEFVKFAGLAACACLALALVGCGTEPEVSSAPQAPAQAAATESQGAAAESPFGTERVWSNGLSITVSEPKSLRPSETSYPPSARTAVFTLTVSNGSTSSYRTNQLAVRAQQGGEPIAEIMDSVQGLNGMASAMAEVPPGSEAVVTLAYAVPSQPVRVRLVVEPNGADQEPVATFGGNA